MLDTRSVLHGPRLGRKKAIFAYLLAILVAVATLTSTSFPALASAPFEKPPVVNAKTLVPAKFLKGEGYTVNRQVPIAGFLGRFTLHTQYGKLEVAGRELLRIRVGEIRAIRALDKQNKATLFVTTAKDAALRPVHAVKQVAESPKETLEGIPTGVERFFHGAYRRAKKTTMDFVDTVTDYTQEKSEGTEREKSNKASDEHLSGEPEMAEKVVTKVGDMAKDFFGYNKARRQLAKQLAIDPYTTNPVLNQKLDEAAWAAFAGGMTFKLAVPIPDAVSYTTRVSNLVWDLPPADLEEANEKTLEAMGITGRPVRELFRNKWFSPTLATSLVTALNRLTGATGREGVIALAATLASEEEARWLTGSTQILAHYHKAVTPITEVKIVGTIVGRNHGGDTILPLQADYIAWTPLIAEFTQHPDLQTKKRSIWISGKFSPRARKEMAALGWTTKEEVRFSKK